VEVIEMAKPKGGLAAWFGKGKKGDWVDIGAPKKKGKHQACGRKSAKGSSKRSYPKCVPRATANKMTTAQKKSAVTRKRAAGNPGGKPNNVKTFVRKKRRSKK
jgi:hypothetical protein